MSSTLINVVSRPKVGLGTIEHSTRPLRGVTAMTYAINARDYVGNEKSGEKTDGCTMEGSTPMCVVCGIRLP